MAVHQHTPQRSLHPRRSPVLTLLCFSLRLGVSAVNILWLRLGRAAFIGGQIMLSLVCIIECRPANRDISVVDIRQRVSQLLSRAPDPARITGPPTA